MIDNDTLIMKRLKDYYLIRQNLLSTNDNLKITQAVQQRVFPPFLERFKPVSYSMPFQNVGYNEFTPLTHKHTEELRLNHFVKPNSFKQQSKLNCKKILNHQIKKQIQNKIGRQVQKYIQITLHFQESMKDMNFLNYNISGINTLYELKLQIFNQLDVQRLFISQYIQSYIDRSEIQINNQTVNDRTEICKLQNKKQFTILVFSSITPMLNPSHKYEPNHAVLLNEQQTLSSYKISNFSIEFEDKKISWIDKVDISYINFTEIVSNKLEIYNLNRIGYFRIPNQGKKLNKRRLIKQVIPEELLILSITNDCTWDEVYTNQKIQQHCQLMNYELDTIDINGGFYQYYQE